MDTWYPKSVVDHSGYPGGLSYPPNQHQLQQQMMNNNTGSHLGAAAIQPTPNLSPYPQQHHMQQAYAHHPSAAAAASGAYGNSHSIFGAGHPQFAQSPPPPPPASAMMMPPPQQPQAAYHHISQQMQQQQSLPVQMPNSSGTPAASQLQRDAAAAANGANSNVPSLNNLYKTQLCKHYQQTKHCHVGNKCHFAHGENELRKKEDTLPVDVQMKMLNIPYNNFKTQKCKYFFNETPGQCKFGKNCSYAHGDQDIRNPYENIDIGELVKEHYGIDGYDPNSPFESVPVIKSGTSTASGSNGSSVNQSTSSAGGGTVLKANSSAPIKQQDQRINVMPSPVPQPKQMVTYPAGIQPLPLAKSMSAQHPTQQPQQGFIPQYVPKNPAPQGYIAQPMQPLQNGHPLYVKKSNSGGAIQPSSYPQYPLHMMPVSQSQMLSSYPHQKMPGPYITDFRSPVPISAQHLGYSVPTQMISGAPQNSLRAQVNGTLSVNQFGSVTSDQSPISNFPGSSHQSGRPITSNFVTAQMQNPWGTSQVNGGSSVFSTGGGFNCMLLSLDHPYQEEELAQESSACQ